MHSKLILVGGGGHALVVAEAARLAGHELLGFFDDNPQAALGHKLGVARLGGLVDFYKHAEGDSAFIVALGDLRLRTAFLADLSGKGLNRAATIVHPHASISPTAALAPGVFVGPRAVVHTLANVHAHAVINSGAIVEHECQIGENAHVAPGAALAGNVSVGRGSLVGIGSRVLPGIHIGAGATVGAGAVVVQDVPDGVTVVGVPARSLNGG